MCPTYREDAADHLYLGPYDAIHVGAAAPTLPQALVDQLGRPGRMFIPVGDYLQEIWQVDKDEVGEVTRKKLLDVRVRSSFPAMISGADRVQVCPIDGQGSTVQSMRGYTGGAEILAGLAQCGCTLVVVTIPVYIGRDPGNIGHSGVLS